jgi:serine/threonine-protein kinase
MESQVLKEKYEIREHVGKGGMGKVYRSFDRSLKREVAIKEFSPSQGLELDTETLQELEEAFQREATLLANLNHSSLPIVYESFTEGNKLYIVMEFVEGDNLKKTVKELKERYDGQLPVEKIKRWTKELLEVLIYLHDRESPIYHRDIKPDNLKVRNEKVCLLDFGLAKGTAGSIPSIAAQTTYGFTARYAPVEQMRGEKTTAQTDLYALAATVYYLLTGEEPIDARTRERQITDNRPDPLRDIKILRPEVDNSFADVIRQALSVEARGRPESARAMLGKLENRFKTAEGMPRIQVPLESTILPPTMHIAPAMPQFHTPTTRPLQSPARRWRSYRKLMVAALAVITILCVVIVIALKIIVADDPAPSLFSKKILQVDCRLYSLPGDPDANSTDTLSRNTKVLIENCRSITSKGKKGIWYQVKVVDNSKAGWIFCKDEKECSEDKGLCFSPE